jgi:hypothetical protein
VSLDDDAYISFEKVRKSVPVEVLLKRWGLVLRTQPGTGSCVIEAAKEFLGSKGILLRLSQSRRKAVAFMAEKYPMYAVLGKDEDKHAFVKRLSMKFEYLEGPEIAGVADWVQSLYSECSGAFLTTISLTTNELLGFSLKGVTEQSLACEWGQIDREKIGNNTLVFLYDPRKQHVDSLVPSKYKHTIFYNNFRLHCFF